MKENWDPSFNEPAALSEPFFFLAILAVTTAEKLGVWTSERERERWGEGGEEMMTNSTM